MSEPSEAEVKEPEAPKPVAPTPAPVPATNVWAQRAAAAKEKEAAARTHEAKTGKSPAPPKAAAAPAPAAPAEHKPGPAPSAWKRADDKPVEREVKVAVISSAAPAEAAEAANGDYVTERVKVKPECAGFIVGQKGHVINEIAQHTFTHIVWPRRGEEPAFTISGAGPCVKAAIALILVREEEASDRETKGGGNAATESKTEKCTVPESLVGYVMGSQHAVINDISRQTRTQIVCPVKGGKPDFEITGAPICVDAACACIDSKVYQASGRMNWQMESWFAPETISITVPPETVGMIVGVQGMVISQIAMQTNTAIISPKKGQDPVFVVTGQKHCVQLAKAAIEAKVHGARNYPMNHNKRKGPARGKKFTSLPSVVTWFPMRAATRQNGPKK